MQKEIVDDGKKIKPVVAVLGAQGAGTMALRFTWAKKGRIKKIPKYCIENIKFVQIKVLDPGLRSLKPPLTTCLALSEASLVYCLPDTIIYFLFSSKSTTFTDKSSASGSIRFSSCLQL